MVSFTMQGNIAPFCRANCHRVAAFPLLELGGCCGINLPSQLLHVQALADFYSIQAPITRHEASRDSEGQDCLPTQPTRTSGTDAPLTPADRPTRGPGAGQPAVPTAREWEIEHVRL